MSCSFHLCAYSGVSTGFNATHACFICDGHKDQETGYWVKGNLRTFYTSLVDFNGYDAGGRRNRLQKNNNNQIREPMLMSRDLQQPLVNFMKPDSLHVVKLGVQNDIITNIQHAFPEIVGPWLEKLKQKRERGGMPGRLAHKLCF